MPAQHSVIPPAINASRRSYFLSYLLCIAFLAGCGRKDEPARETILARVGDRTISVNEFIRRAEYTVRPDYCRGDNYIHKKIILNSLIAEKLFALEAGENYELANNETFQLYLQGRQEQAMRQWLYYTEAYEKVQLDTSEVRESFRIAGRKYTVAYYTIGDSSIAAELAAQVARGDTVLESYFREESSGAIPRREVEWNSPEHPVIHEALFSRLLQKNEVIGPLKIEDGQNIFMKILGWAERKAISDAQIRRRWDEVKEKLTARHAEKLFEKIVAETMRGKRLEFAPITFRKVVETVGPFYLKTFEEKKAAFNRQFWQQETDAGTLATMGQAIDKMLDEPFFRIDDEIWTVRDFERYLKVHPLVFRKKRIGKSEFAEQFKLAIADMLRDRFLTERAYEKGYDKVEAVQRNVAMWKDNLAYLYQQKKVLRSLGKTDEFGKNYVEVIERDLNPYVRSLQQKYAARIEINTEAFEKIDLTSVSMFVVQRNVPFPVVVPGFPVVTTLHALDYGRKMKAE